MRLKNLRMGTKILWPRELTGFAAFLLFAPGTPAQTHTAVTQTAEEHDGQHDFDFEVGTWKIHLKKLVRPLTGSTTWVEFDGTTVTRKVWEGRAFLEEFETNGSAGRVKA